MKTLLIITALTVALGYFEPMGPPVCDDCPLPDVLPVPEPTPTIPEQPWRCFKQPSGPEICE